MNWVRIFTLAFAGKVAGSIFIAACVFLGVGPEKWVEFILGPAVTPWIGRVLLFVLAILTFLFVFFGGRRETLRNETFNNPANFALHRKRKKSTPDVVLPKREFGSDMWRLLETSSLREAAAKVYGETRDSLAAGFAEVNNASEADIIEWYAYAITGCADVYAHRPPSYKYEKINLRAARLVREKYGDDFYSPIHEKAKWDDIRVLNLDIPHIAKTVAGWGKDNVEERRTDPADF